MSTKNCRKFKGDIENYLKKSRSNFESTIDGVFSDLNFKTWLCKANIIKREGYHAAHILFILLMLPLLRSKTVHGFCKKHWQNWSLAQKDTLYRFQQNDKYRWRSFMTKISQQILHAVELENIPQEDRCVVVDDTVLAKRGKKMQNVSYVYDHNAGRTVLGYCIATLGLLIPHGFYPLDFAFRFSSSRNAESPEAIGDCRKSSGQRSYEAKHHTKLELALMMIRRAVANNLMPGYVLFDSWYAWPQFIQAIRKIDESIHVICRLKDSNVRYEYKGDHYKLSELYNKVKHQLKKDYKTGLLLTRVQIGVAGSNEKMVIVLAKGYTEPEVEPIKGKKKQKASKWAAFLSTHTRLHSATIIRKYAQRWPVEVCFKECKQQLGLGKEQSNDFNAQVFSITASFLRYNILNYLNKFENYASKGELFEYIADQSAVLTYAQRLWDFFREMLGVSIAAIFKLFSIEDDISTYVETVNESLQAYLPIRGCET